MSHTSYIWTLHLSSLTLLQQCLTGPAECPKGLSGMCLLKGKRIPAEINGHSWCSLAANCLFISCSHMR